MIKHKL